MESSMYLLGQPPASAAHRAARSRLDEAMPDRVPGQLDSVTHPQLLEDVRSMTLDGLDADREHRGDLLRLVCLGNQLQHLLLTRRERAHADRLAASVDDIARERGDCRRIEEGLA